MQVFSSYQSQVRLDQQSIGRGRREASRNTENSTLSAAAIKEKLAGFNLLSAERAGIIVRVKIDGAGSVNKLLKFLADTGINIISFNPKKVTLQDIYLKTVGK